MKTLEKRKSTLENMNSKKEKKEIGFQLLKSLIITILYSKREQLRSANKDGSIT